MDELLLATRHYPWFERLKEAVVSTAARVMSLRSGVFWTLSYILLLALMYLFHSPFRSQLDTRTDWYAQVTKGLQIWLAVVLLCFHVGPHLVASRSGTAGAATSREMAEQTKQHSLGEDTVATVFFPVFCFSSSLCLFLHKVKRRYRLVVTYGPSFSVVMINSVLLASFATLHYTACSDVFSVVDAALGSPQASWTLPFLGGPASTSAWMPASKLVCPAFVTEKPFACLNFLCCICSGFVAVDYWYKRWHADGNPLRGILWADTYPEKESSKESAGAVAASSRATFLFCRWGLLRTEMNLESVARRLRLSKDDPRLQEAAPATVTLPSRAKLAQRWGDSDTDPTGWQDEHDRLSIAAEPHVAHPTNRPGMVPWFSTFIMNTTWQALARMSLEFLTFDVRTLQHYVRPRVFTLHFGSALEALPRLPIEPHEQDKYADNTSAAGDPSTLAQAAVSDTPLHRENTAVPSPAATTAAGPRPANDPDIWFDWIADVGDGFNPTYAMARLLGRPVLKLPWHRPPSRSARLPFLSYSSDVTPAGSPKVQAVKEVLPRGSFVVVGGDLAYPSPDDETYTTRLFEPYHDAMSGNVRLQNLFHAEQQHVVVADAADADVAHVHLLDAATVSAMATGRAALRTGRATAEEALRSVPLLFAIPGNHDWFDGLTTFRKYILERTWIGGWLMPQRSSFFVLRLPHNWFMLCGDTGNMQDIDVAQRNYFLDVIEKYMNAESCVILAAHEPGWVLDAMERDEKPRQPELNRVVEVLGTRLRLRMAGDIHHYSRHTPRDTASEAATLVVSGGGGAFLHGARNDNIISQGTKYVRSGAFPDRNTFMNMATRLWGFRVVNWKFDLVVGFLCFVMLLSVLPLPLESDLGDDGDKVNGSPAAGKMRLAQLFSLWVAYTTEIMWHVVSRGIVSLGPLFFFLGCFSSAGSDRHAPLAWRLCYGASWTFAVFLCCSGAMAFLQVQLAYLLNHGLLHSAGGTWGSELEAQAVLLTSGALANAAKLVGGEGSLLCRGAAAVYGMVRPLVPLRPLLVVLRCLDPFEALAFLSITVSSGEVGVFAAAASRLQVALYYVYVLFFYWVLVTPLVSVVIGTFLLFSVTTFDYMYDGTYSAFQMEEYKHFIRFRLDAATRELHAYVVAVEKPSKVYRLDRGYLWSLAGPGLEEHRPPHLKQHPSRWAPVQRDEQRKRSMTEILEHFTVYPHRVPQPRVKTTPMDP